MIDVYKNIYDIEALLPREPLTHDEEEIVISHKGGNGIRLYKEPENYITSITNPEISSIKDEK